jgi:hypothetical protein
MKKSILILLVYVWMQSLSAQTLEPKLYANTPIGLNALLVGYGYSEGAMPDNLSLGLDNPNLNINTLF